MRNPICLFKTLWRSLRHLNLVSGHEFTTSEQPTPANVHVLICRQCGKTSVAWSWDNLEEQK